MTYRMKDDTIVDTQKATAHWAEATRWNGSNHISRATGKQFEHETLYKSSKGRYYIESTSNYEGTTPTARWVEPIDAARWLLSQDEELPADLARYEEEVSE